MKCPKCNADLGDQDFAFCPKCGEKLPGKSEQENQSEQGSDTTSQTDSKTFEKYQDPSDKVAKPKKKYVWIVVLVLVILLLFILIRACSGGGKSNNNSGASSAYSKDISTSSAEKVDLQSLSTSQQCFYFAPKNAYSKEDKIYGSYAFEVTNTFDVPIMVSSYTVDFVDASGTILGHDDNANLIPHILQPGEKGYCGSFARAITSDPANVSQMKVTLNVERTNKKVEMFDFENVNMLYSQNDVKATGTVINNTSSDSNNMTSIVVVCFDKDDHLIGAQFAAVNSKIEKGKSATFEANFSNTNLTKDKVAKVMAFGYASQLIR
ncbi:FxLYD domain-containing protein [Caproicibacterium sp. BJN0003]|uniref:FxLYD domain-containing protein n=1 Tax=Caproicibacterium sp. BJN0003 TaxID=2994078 RepID=UPI0022588A85|nr:FxLYD domain-containing protein [Caproicibacterium sp. BJN0003]UZT82667.1 FxLYD domain-containing protein [Caproicibacterium sp. BJN0003]